MHIYIYIYIVRLHACSNEVLISDKENHAYIFQYNLIVLLKYLHTAALLHSVI